MKNVIIGLYIATGALGLLMLSTSANNKEHKQVKLIPQAMYCPVVGDFSIPRPSHNNTIDPEIPIYTHCPSCMAGVFTESEAGARRCSFCNKPE